MRNWGQAEVASAAQVHQSTVSRWLSYKGIVELKVTTVLLLEEALGLAHGDLTLPATALRARRHAVAIEHQSLPPDAARQVDGMVRKLLRKRSV